MKVMSIMLRAWQVRHMRHHDLLKDDILGDQVTN